MLGRTDWFDLPVADLADAMSFYEGLLGWTYRQMENSPLSDYVMIDVAGKLIGGLRKVPSPKSPLPRGEGASRPGEGMAPVLYFTVEKLTPAVARAKELGAEIVGQTVELGKDRGRYQWIRDRAGNLIALWASQ
jgi:predicted enzyme related to lactoylglutathione lyase